MWKRAFDVTVSAIALVMVLPLLVVIAVAIKLDSPGPILYQATRIGRGGIPFKVYKFRSMVANADRLGPGITAAGDRRVTRVGRILRRTKLDELPQLINVLRGDMSLVGPRPEDPRYVALYLPEEREVLKVRPGITSPASVRYRHEEAVLAGDGWEFKYITEVMPSKLAIDLEYVRNSSLWRDLVVLFQTFAALWE